MQGSFEKDVQGKMEELKLMPSAPVWEKIEVEIKVEKKKRRVLLWFVLAGLLLASALLYQLLNEKPGSATGQIIQRPITIPNKKEETNTTTTEKKSGNNETKERKNESLVSKSEKQVGTKPLPKGRKPDGQQDLVLKDDEQFSSQPKLASSPQSSIKKRKEQSTNERPSRHESAPLTSEQNLPVTSVADTQTTAPYSKPATTDSITNRTELMENPTTPKTDTSTKKKVALANKNKWRKQIIVGGGMSAYAANLLTSGTNSALFYSAPGVSSTPPQPTQPSGASSGHAFTLGFALSKKLSDRWEVSVGLQYSYASTHQKVGDKKAADTAVQFSMDKTTANGFYTNTGSDDYTNRFHFIEIPVSVSFKPSLSLPLYLSLGAAYARLLSTNALTYSGSSNLYYQNKQNNLRNALLVFSSVQAEFFGRKKLSLRAGPYLQYNLIKAQKEAVGGTPHLFVAGVKASLIF